MSEKNKINILQVGNVYKSYKDFLVHVDLKNGEVYAVSFRRDPETDTISQLTVFQNQWVNDDWGYMPRMLEKQMYLNTLTNELELHQENAPEHCTIVTYEMFDKVGWACGHKYPPR